LANFIPGAILSFSILRKDGFNFVEKLLIGFALGIIILPLIPFLLYFVAGVKFSYTIALLTVAVMYAIALAAFAYTKAYEDVLALINRKHEPKAGKADSISIPTGAIIQVLLLLILLSTYLTRIGSYSPIFEELDPYYYTYVPHQLLTLGENPANDQTAWYPDVVVGHRDIPEISYLESTWYSLYTAGAQESNMLLAAVASTYPPVAALLAVFGIYLLVSTATKREWGLVAAGIAAFMPIFIYKLSAGEQEVQPYAFFALFFFYAMYAIALRRGQLSLAKPMKEWVANDLKFAALAGLGFAALALGSSSQIVAILSIAIFTTVQAILYFLRDDDTKNLRSLIATNGVVFLIGPVIGSMLLRDIFQNGNPSLSIAVSFLLPLAFAAALYVIKERVRDRNTAWMALAALLLAGLVVYAFTPLGGYVKNLGQSAFSIAQFNAPLDRTIAEQNLAGTSFGEGQIGFVAETYDGIASALMKPIAPNLAGPLGSALSYIFGVFSLLANFGLSLFVGVVNFFLGTGVEFSSKDNSLLLFWIVAFLAAAIYCGWKAVKKGEDNNFLLFIAMVLPVIVVGLIKMKYTIYAGAFLAVAIGFTLAMAERIARGPLEGALKDKNLLKNIQLSIFIIGALLVILQFTYQGVSPALIWGSFQPLYQNDPAALAPKLSQICADSKDAEVCAAASDPVGYASKGTNYQYSTKLCFLSIFSNYTHASDVSKAPPWELVAARSRCSRLSEYWINSMEWIRDSTEADSRTTSWWDYGHWINYFGQRDTVLRNEHASHAMIGDVAHGYLDGTPQELKEWMLAHDSKYALFDMELISGGGSLGGKYGALNYLSCARDNGTSVVQKPGQSQCEADHLWETILVAGTPCTISSLTGKTGMTAYKVYAGQSYLPDYPWWCSNPTTSDEQAYCRNYVHLEPVYCVGEVVLADGQKTYGTYYLNETYSNGDLKLNKATLELANQVTTTHVGNATAVTLFYTNEKMWLENGVAKSGYEDRKGKFYDSNLYRALFLNDLPGFTQAYATKDGMVKIYKITE